MSTSIRQQAANIQGPIETRNMNVIKEKTGNVYESIDIIAKRSNQINIALKEELYEKLEEFATNTDSLEEVHENKEQIEISKAFERLANPAKIATEEFLEDKIYFKQNEGDLFE